MTKACDIKIIFRLIDFLLIFLSHTNLRKNSIENHITTIISITNKRAIACSSYSSIVEKTLKAKHVKTIKKLQMKGSWFNIHFMKAFGF